eukprot:COSAG06_NODE_5198_length_3644_cov_8.858674_3_plen_88_part_00
MNFRQYTGSPCGTSCTGRSVRGHGPIGYWNHNYFMAEDDNGGGGGGDGASSSSSSSKFWIVPWDMDGETIYTRLYLSHARKPRYSTR